MEIVIGIDLGTQGVRVLAVDQNGIIACSVNEQISLTVSTLPSGWSEQNPEAWWTATATCLRHLSASLPTDAHIAGIAIDSTSGTVLPITNDGKPLHPALMYNDARSESFVSLVHAQANSLEQRLGYAFNSSYALPKLLWLQHMKPEIRAQTSHYVHAADFIAGRLTGDYAVTDYSNALKTGFDLINGVWPSFIEHALGLEINKLPRVVAPGQAIGSLTSLASLETGLSTGIPVFGGATDGTAAQIASGAVEPGSWNTSLGTTLVIKGITKELLIDAQRRIYSHRHPDGWWMPGGASNTGSEWIVREYPGQNLPYLDQIANQLTPTGIIRYPLARKGERFPFLQPDAQGFVLMPDSSTSVAIDDRYYAAGLEGTAMLERLSYETLTQIGAVVGPRIYSTGGGSKSAVWMKIRASMLNRQLVRPLSSETAMGAAVLAARGAWFANLNEASRALVRPDITVDPDKNLVMPYDDMYLRFCTHLRSIGYLGV